MVFGCVHAGYIQIRIYCRLPVHVYTLATQNNLSQYVGCGGALIRYLWSTCNARARSSQNPLARGCAPRDVSARVAVAVPPKKRTRDVFPLPIHPPLPLSAMIACLGYRHRLPKTEQFFGGSGGT